MSSNQFNQAELAKHTMTQLWHKSRFDKSPTLAGYCRLVAIRFERMYGVKIANDVVSVYSALKSKGLIK